MTEGILLRQMTFDPGLRSVSAILFDEFHERHLYGDISLARALEIQRHGRPDLLIAVMSATLTRAPSAYLAPCDVLVSRATHPVRIEYLARPVNLEADPVWSPSCTRPLRDRGDTRSGR